MGHIDGHMGVIDGFCCRVLRMGHIDGHMGVIDGEAYGTYMRKCERRRWINSAMGKEK